MMRGKLLAGTLFGHEYASMTDFRPICHFLTSVKSNISQ